MTSLNLRFGIQVVVRSDIFDEVLRLYTTEENLFHEYPIRIKFKDERAIDTGGVVRDMHSGFFVECIVRFSKDQQC